MSTVIHKYELTEMSSVLALPETAKVLHVAEQRRKYIMWVHLNPEAPKVPRRFVIYATGEIMEDSSTRVFVGTIVAEMGSYVWHIFEEPLR
jgi:hypothetical protein